MIVEAITNKEYIEDAAKCGAFMQKFKMMMWEHMTLETKIDEKVLDKIAMEIYDYFKKV